MFHFTIGDADIVLFSDYIIIRKLFFYFFPNILDEIIASSSTLPTQISNIINIIAEKSYDFIFPSRIYSENIIFIGENTSKFIIYKEQLINGINIKDIITDEKATIIQKLEFIEGILTSYPSTTKETLFNLQEWLSKINNTLETYSVTSSRHIEYLLFDIDKAMRHVHIVSSTPQNLN